MARLLHVPKDAIMPTIKTRKQANGVTRYTAIIRMRRGGAIIHRESKTFAHRTAALSMMNSLLSKRIPKLEIHPIAGIPTGWHYLNVPD